jgi:hypothetical protein
MDSITKEQVWSSSEIKQLLLYAKELEEANETMRASVIMMQAALDNETAKVKQLANMVTYLTNVNSQMLTYEKRNQY